MQNLVLLKAQKTKCIWLGFQHFCNQECRQGSFKIPLSQYIYINLFKISWHVRLLRTGFMCMTFPRVNFADKMLTQIFNNGGKSINSDILPLNLGMLWGLTKIIFPYSKATTHSMRDIYFHVLYCMFSCNFAGT